MQALRDLKNRTPHDDMLAGNNSSYLVASHFPTGSLDKILPRGMSIPPRDFMAEKYPTVQKIDGMHPFMMMFSNSRNVHDVITGIELRHYRELMFFIPVIYTHGHEEQHCSYVPVLYLDYLIGVIGGLFLGLRKEFRPGMQEVETGSSKSFIIRDVLTTRFQKHPGDKRAQLDPFFSQIFANPIVTLSYLNQVWFYTTKIHVAKVLGASAEVQWNFKGATIENTESTFANYAEYAFTTSQAMRYGAYFHPRYSIKR